MMTRIANKLLVLLLLVALIPLGMGGILAYWRASVALKTDILTRLEVLANERVDHIERFYAERRENVRGRATSPWVAETLPEMAAAYVAGGLDSAIYRDAMKKHEPTVNWLFAIPGAHDVFLIAANGDVVFTARKEGDLGTNLRYGRFKDTELGRVFDRALGSADVVTSNLNVYEPSGKPAVFVAMAVRKGDRLLGAFAAQMDIDDINAVARDYAGLGTSGETVLVTRRGSETLFVAPTRHDPGAAFIRRVVEGSPAGLPAQEASAGRAGRGEQEDYRGLPTMAAWRHMPAVQLGLVIKMDRSEALAPVHSLAVWLLCLGLLSAAVAFAMALLVARVVSLPVVALTRASSEIAGGNLETPIPSAGRDEIGGLSAAMERMQAALRENVRDLKVQNELRTGQTQLAETMRGDQDVETLCRNIVTFLAKRLGALTGVMYLADGDGSLRLAASYAHKRRKNLASSYRPGEGLVGQAALEKEDIVLTNVPDDYITIESGLGEAKPRNIYVKPIVHNDKVAAVVELGALASFSEAQSLFLNSVAESIAITIESAKSRSQLTVALKQSQQLSEELQAQQEELRAANEELEEQTQRLQQSEEELKTQREELQVTNEELEEKSQALERQNRQVEQARGELAKKAEELATASKYKSEFLANMSHELRTPLNSLLLLSRSFAENKPGNLTEDQVESARAIHQSGSDLLNLINEILDLSKIEAGRMTLGSDDVPVADLAGSVRAGFQHLAADKGLTFDVAILSDAPEQITTDRQRIEQIIRNLVSNAIKFTEQGSVAVTFGPANTEFRVPSSPEMLSISVADTGIGIAPEHQQAIFEAFQQADGGIARKYGGTGLGLAITRELVKLLGGELRLQSEVGKGSTFTVYLPVQSLPNADLRLPNEGQKNAKDAVPAPAEQSAIGNLKSAIPDDRQAVGAGDRTILIVEDDVRFAETLVKQCREKGFKCVACTRGEEGLELARRYRPNGIILDIRLPGIDGWKVLERLKEDPAVRHIPVHIISVDEPSLAAMRKGAIGQLRKPVTREGIEEALRKLQEAGQTRVKTVLVADDDRAMRRSIVEILAARDVKVEEAATGGQALAALRAGRYDCLVLDLDLGDMTGGQVLKKVVEEERLPLPPVIVNTARDLTPAEVAELSAYSDSIVIKDVRSQERLLDEASLFLHRVVADLPESQRQAIARLHPPEAALQGKKVLVVDDDMRTVFALARLLGDCGLTVVKAENGEKALSALAAQPDVDLVLMDIMMPVLDGLETMRRIRAQERHAKLPIIALTAKAMKGDREQCLAAGASDYLPKPLDPDRLLSLMRVWLCR
jgi:CheY-like chemotaxis protein/HAMP domain-containing protein